MNPTPHSAENQPLKRFAFILRLREGSVEAYEKAHREVWPEMLDVPPQSGYGSMASQILGKFL